MASALEHWVVMVRNIRQQQNGFTLVEVLVASLLLFIAISLVTLAYRTGIQSERTVEKRVFKTAIIRFVEQNIAEQLRLQPDLSAGSGVWGEFEYDWQVLNRYEKLSKSGFNLEIESYAEIGRKLQLTEIEIAMGNDSYVYAHLSWR